MPRFFRLADGNQVSPLDVKSIVARTCRTPFVDQHGDHWPALVEVETRNRTLRVPHASLADAEAERDAIAAAGDAEQERMQRRPGGYAVAPLRTLPAGYRPPMQHDDGVGAI